MDTLAPIVICKACGKVLPLGCDVPDSVLTCGQCQNSYEWSDGVLVLGVGEHLEDYPEDVAELLAGVEPHHFWFTGRNRLIVATLRESVGPFGGLRALDIGCGTGFVLGALERAGMEVCGLDTHLDVLGIARRRTRGLLVCDSAAQLPFVSQFDVALLCDVIEHTPDDVAVLREARRVLRADGVVLVTVPAGPGLWTVVDDVSGHKRRYTRHSLVHAMGEAGLRVKRVRYFNSLLLPAQVLQRALVNRGASAKSNSPAAVLRQALRVPPAPINALFSLATLADVPLARLGLPFGASLIAIGSPM